MNFNANLERLKSDVASRIQSAKKKRIRYKKQASFVAVYNGLVAAITTVCIGVVSFLPDTYSNFFSVIALLSSASLTVVAAWDGIYKHRQLWVSTATMLNQLYELESDILHAEESNPVLAQEQINVFYERYKKVMRTSNERWYRLRE